MTLQAQTRRLKRIALLASRQEAEFVSGVLEAADIPYAIVEVDQGLELRADPDDAGRVGELIERLDVRQDAAEATRQRRGESAGRRIVLWIVVTLLLAGSTWWAAGFMGASPLVAGIVIVAMSLVSGAMAWVAAIRGK